MKCSNRQVNILDFFEDRTPSKFMEGKNPYGFATKKAVVGLNKNIQVLLKEFEKLQSKLAQKKAAVSKRNGK